MSAPFYTVRVLPEGGRAQAVDLSDSVLSLTFEDATKKADKLSLTLDNSDLRHFDNPYWRRGNILEVMWGYPGRVAPARSCVIRRANGGRVLTIEAYAKSVLMHAKKQRRVWDNTTRAEVVRRIAEEYGYFDAGLRVQDTGIRLAHVTQAGMTDAQFLAHLARKEGFEFWVDHTGLNWRERDYAQAPKKVLTYFTDEVGQILDFNVETSITALTGSVEARGIDPLTKKKVTGKADNNTERKGLATVIEVVDPVSGVTSLQTRVSSEETEHTTSGAGGGSDAAAKKSAEAKYRSNHASAVKMSMSVVGDPELTAKSVVEVRGMGKMLSGKYFVLTARHVLGRSGGYRTELELRKDGTEGYGDGKDAKSKAATNKTKAPEKAGAELRQVEVVDARSGETRIEWRSQ